MEGMGWAMCLDDLYLVQISSSDPRPVSTKAWMMDGIWGVSSHSQ